MNRRDYITIVKAAIAVTIASWIVCAIIWGVIILIPSVSEGSMSQKDGFHELMYEIHKEDQAKSIAYDSYDQYYMLLEEEYASHYEDSSNVQ